MGAPHTVVAVNYHRIGTPQPGNPLHRLHSIDEPTFRAQLAHLRSRGPVVSLDQARRCEDLAELNFIVTFDDAPLSAITGIDIMSEQGLPMAISVCGHLAEHGHGTRDLVYCIEQLADPEVIRQVVNAWLGQLPEISIYHLTKRDDLHPAAVKTHLIDPLFETIRDAATPLLAKPAYLGWEAIANAAENPLVTVVNHGWSHANVARFSSRELQTDIDNCHQALSKATGRAPRYFAVPFGRISQALAYDLVEQLTHRGYDGLLWVGEPATRLRGQYRHQLLQLTRLHTPTTVDDLITAVDRAIDRAQEAAIWQVPPTQHRRPITFIESSDQDRVQTFETLIRQGKDYASDPDFYHHQFTGNPSKGCRPDYYATERAGRIEAAAYNFHTSFSLTNRRIPGVYVAGWRRLPESHVAAAGHLVRTIAKREAIVGVHRPSTDAEPAFHDWLRVPMTEVTIDLDRVEALDGSCDVLQVDHHVPEIDILATHLHDTVDFTVARDRTYHQWRHEQYPLATCKYVVLRHRDEPVAYAVTLTRGDRLQIADWYGTSPHRYDQLLAAVAVAGRFDGSASLHLTTDDLDLGSKVATSHGGTQSWFANYYHFDTEKLSQCGITDFVAADHAALRVHETATSGDVLIRQ